MSLFICLCMYIYIYIQGLKRLPLLSRQMPVPKKKAVHRLRQKSIAIRIGFIKDGVDASAGSYVHNMESELLWCENNQ